MMRKAVVTGAVAFAFAAAVVIAKADIMWDSTYGGAQGWLDEGTRATASEPDPLAEGETTEASEPAMVEWPEIATESTPSEQVAAAYPEGPEADFASAEPFDVAAGYQDEGTFAGRTMDQAMPVPEINPDHPLARSGLLYLLTSQDIRMFQEREGARGGH